MVNTRVGDDNQARLLELAGDVVCETTRGETTSDGLCTGVGSKFEYGTLTVRTSRDDTNIRRVVDGSDYACSKDDLFPSLADVNEVDTCPTIRRHPNC